MDMTGYHEISKKVQRRSTSICSKSRTLICLSGIVLMCVVGYVSRSGYNSRLQILETQIENLHAVIDERVNEGLERTSKTKCG
uniref:Uncharacterized protein n=1 Tax=Ciona savignyi TaxID=51511 RepID=H2Y555_CIOSA